MEDGEQIIIQAALQHERWSGRADILRRIEKPSALGAWSYEIIDTKLARETKGGTVLQLCLYADLLEQAQGVTPEYVYVVAPWSNCVSTQVLRDWLEARRTELIASGTDVPRPAPGQEGPSEELSARQEQINLLIERLTHDVPVDPEQRTTEQQARWILAHLLGWHRREDKATWWEYFRLAALTADELIDERAALSRLTLVGTVDQSKTGIPTHRYRFEQQDTDLRGDEDLKVVGGEQLGKAVAVSTDERTIDIKKSNDLFLLQTKPELHTHLEVPDRAVWLDMTADFRDLKPFDIAKRLVCCGHGLTDSIVNRFSR